MAVMAISATVVPAIITATIVTSAIAVVIAAPVVPGIAPTEPEADHRWRNVDGRRIHRGRTRSCIQRRWLSIHRSRNGNCHVRHRQRWQREAKAEVNSSLRGRSGPN
jgi:hypothetical protein